MQRRWEGNLPMAERIFNCIICPKCCSIAWDGTLCTGAGCKRGEAFVMQELADPRRTLTTTMRCREGTSVTMIPVKSVTTVPLADITDIVTRLKSITLTGRPPIGSEIVIESIHLRITG